MAKQLNGVLRYDVGVYVYIDDGFVTKVVVDDDNVMMYDRCDLIEGKEKDKRALFDAANNSQMWPSWEFGF